MEQTFFAAFQIFNFLLLATWLLLTISTIIALQRRKFSTSQHIAWTVLIIFIPFLGAAIFWLRQPSQN